MHQCDRDNVMIGQQMHLITRLISRIVPRGTVFHPSIDHKA